MPSQTWTQTLWPGSSSSDSKKYASFRKPTARLSLFYFTTSRGRRNFWLLLKSPPRPYQTWAALLIQQAQRNLSKKDNLRAKIKSSVRTLHQKKNQKKEKETKMRRMGKRMELRPQQVERNPKIMVKRSSLKKILQLQLHSDDECLKFND